MECTQARCLGYESEKAVKVAVDKFADDLKLSREEVTRLKEISKVVDHLCRYTQ